MLGAVALGAWWRLAPVPSALLFGDEIHSLRDLPQGYAFLATHFSPTGSGLALPLLQRAGADLFGLTSWSVRLPAFLPGVALVAALFWIGRPVVGAGAAAVASFLAASNGFLVFYSHFGRSYALVCLLALLLLGLLQRIVDGARADLRLAGGAGLVAAVCPLVHPASLGLVLPVYAAAWLSLRLARRRRDAGAVMMSLGGALVAAVLLHVPAWESLVAFVGDKTRTDYYGDFGPAAVANVLFGGPANAAVAAVLVALALAGFARRGGRRSLPLLASCLGPVLLLGLLRPFGDPYAYARYLSAGLPAALLAVGWGVAATAGRLVAPGRRERAVLALGVALAALQWLGGPDGPRRTPDGPHRNTYLSLQPLPPFDIPWDRASAFYREVAGRRERVRLLEVPALPSRTRPLYRNHFLTHGRETRLGFLPSELAEPPCGPYVSLADPAWPERAREVADYLVLHHDITREIEAYWSFVYEANAEATAAAPIAAVMQRHRRYEVPREADIAAVRERLGPEAWRDEWIAVWPLREGLEVFPR